MYSDFAVNKYLHTVASGWIFINIQQNELFLNECFNFLMSFTCFDPEGSSSGRRLYIQLWYGIKQ